MPEVKVAGFLESGGTLVTTEEAAARLRISPRTLEAYRVDGGGPRYFKVGPGRRSKVVYRLSDVDEWLTKFGRGSTSEGPEDGKKK